MTDDSTSSDGDRRLQAGWQGRYYGDFSVGDVYKHPYGRTLTETDNVWLSNLTMNASPMHFNEHSRRRRPAAISRPSSPRSHTWTTRNTT